MDEHREAQFIPNHMRSFRMDANLTQREVAFLLDIQNAGRISEWENGMSNPSLEHLLTLSLIYNRLPDQIYYGQRKQLALKLEARRELLLELKRRKGSEGG